MYSVKKRLVKKSAALSAEKPDMKFDEMKDWCRMYANSLSRHGLHEKRAELMKCVETDNATCKQCGSVIVSESNCQSCHPLTPLSRLCAVCELPSRGSFVACWQCGHGGCESHVNQWF